MGMGTEGSSSSAFWKQARALVRKPLRWYTWPMQIQGSALLGRIRAAAWKAFTDRVAQAGLDMRSCPRSSHTG